MSNIYNYSVINDFGGTFSAGQFDAEIRNDPSITTTLEYVEVLGDVISVVFVSAISSPELTALNNLVTNFVLEPTNANLESDGKIILKSNLADPNAIDLRNGDPNGGLSFTIGLGGVRMQSDNTIQFFASAESKFTTSAGNLIFDTAGLLNMDSSSGFNFGVNNDIPINIGNSTGVNTLMLTSGTGGTHLNSTGNVNINSTGGSLNLGNNADNQNINISANGSRIVTIGNTNNFSAVNIVSGSFGATFGNDSSGGEIQIAATNPKVVKVGNSLSGTKVFQRNGDGGFFKSQPSHTSLADSDVTLTVTQLLTGILIMDPSANRNITLPDASTIVSSVSSLEVDDSLDFTIMNTTLNTEELSLLMGSGGTDFGVMTIDPRTNSTFRTSGSGYFRLRMTNVTSSTESYSVYRVC